MKKITYSLILWFGCFSGAISQTLQASLIDLNSETGLSPKYICPGTSKIYFSGFANSFGSELYVLDTHTNQITFVKDIHPGFGSGPTGDAYLTVGDILYFTAESDNLNGSELWRSDGTEAGTYMVKDINPTGSSRISKMVYYNGKLIFNAQNNTYGNELWSSDGTAAGTGIIADILPGVGSFLSGDIVIANNMVYFTAGNNTTGKELWKTDGTAVGTSMVKDIGPSNGISIDDKLTVFNNIIYFIANDGIHGLELWKSDGSAAGTSMVKDIFTGNGSGTYEWHGAATSSYLVFVAYTPATGYALWRSDGTESGTTMLRALQASSGGFLQQISFASFEEKIYFTENDGTGEEVWVTDGTSLGTHVLKNTGNESNDIENLTAVEGYLFFTAKGLSDYATVWKSDGTEEGTSELVQINLNHIGHPEFVAFNGTVFFTGYAEDTGNELWTTNGTSANTHIFEDFNQSASSSPESFTELNGQLLFTAQQQGRRQLFKSAGTAASTVAVKSPNVAPDAVYAYDPVFTNVNGILFFEGNDGSGGKELYKTDGSSQNTALVKDITPGTGGSFPYEVSLRNSLNNIYYFTAFHPQFGAELWRSDGTEEGTYLVKDINPGNANGFENNALISVVFNGQLYFTADDGTSPAIWKTDGTESGTVKVITIPDNFNFDSNPQVIAAIGDKLYFTANINNSSYGNESIWVSDGTPNGSSLLRSFGNNYSLSNYIVYNNELYFAGPGDNFWGSSLFKTDGTVAGTVTVTDHEIGYIHAFHVCGNYLYFATAGIVYDDGLFRTDGSTAGTVQLDGINTGADMHEYECVEGQLLYLKGASGHTISYTNGTTVGELDFNITNAENFTVSDLILGLGHVGSKLFFSTRTERHGEELYVANLESVLAVNSVSAAAALTRNYIMSYPNPTDGLLNVRTGDNSLLESVTIYDLYGKKLFCQLISGKSHQVDLSAFGKGLYLVSAKTETGVYTSKILLK